MARYAAIAGLVLAALSPASPASAAPGDLDPAFSGDGFVLGRSQPAVERASDSSVAPLAVQSGDATVTLGSRREVVRYAADGSRDGSFGDGGAWVSPAGPIDNLAVDGSNRIAVVLGGRPGHVVRLMPDGALDPTFGQAGIAEIGIDPRVSDSALALGPLGEVFVAPGNDEILNLTPAGLPDPTFAGDGYAEVPQGEVNAVADIASRTDGSVLALFGDARGLVQLRPDGTLDPGFGSGGVTAPLCCHQPEFNRAVDLAVAPDGSSYVQAGECAPFGTGPPKPPAPCSAGIVKYDAAGGRVDGFSSDAGPLLAGPFDRGLLVDSEGRLLVGSQGRGGVRVSRFLASGEADTSFGREGTARALPRACESTTREIALDSQARILTSAAACGRWGVLRFVTTPGERDADADQVPDGSDTCPLLAGPEKARGCPTYKPKLRARAQAGNVSGTFAARGACEKRAKVKVALVRGSRLRVVGIARVGADNGRWKVGELKPGTYVAFAPRRLSPRGPFWEGAGGLCARARSGSVRLRP